MTVKLLFICPISWAWCLCYF